MDKELGSNVVKSTESAHRILTVIERLDGAGLTEIAEEIDLSTSAVHKHLNTLTALDYVSKEDKTYHLGLRFLEFGTAARNRLPIYKVGKPEIDRLYRVTDTASVLVVRREDQCVYLYSAGTEPPNSLEGIHAPLDSCVPGQTMLAHLPKNGESNSPADVTDRLESGREFNLAVGERIDAPDSRTAAMPILDEDDAPIGAVGVFGEKHELTRTQIDHHLEGIMQDSVKKITRKLSGDAT